MRAEIEVGAGIDDDHILGLGICCQERDALITGQVEHQSVSVEVRLPQLKEIEMVAAQRVILGSGPGICLAIGERKAVAFECLLDGIEIDIFRTDSRDRRLSGSVLGYVGLQDRGLGGTGWRTRSGTRCRRHWQHHWRCRRHRRRRV